MITALEVADSLDVSKAYAYNLIKKLNTELEEKGFITIPGKVSRQYFQEKVYGMQTNMMKGA